MEKKAYQQPVTRTFIIETAPLMVVSTTGEGSVNSIGFSGSDYSGGTVLSRHSNSVWDDDE